MSLTTADIKALPNLVDQDSRNLAVIYGSLGTLIAFASLIFAILSWLKSRRQKLATATQHRTSDDLELQIVDSRDTQDAAIVDERYASNSAKEDRKGTQLTLHSDSQHMTPKLPAVIVAARSQLSFELREVATALPRTH
jgi:hypothetical protein